MAEDEDGSRSPPLPRGSYNLNFDELDIEAIDPFKSSKGLMNSPDKEVTFNPFASKSKISSSPPNSNHLSEDINPFQTKNKLGSSPPNASGFPVQENPVIGDNESAHDDSADSFKTAIDESPVKCNTGTFVKKKKKSPKASPEQDKDNEGQGDGGQDGGAVAEPKVPEKKPSPKKNTGIKKPKAKSKFKPPANFGVKDSEDVVIFAPPPPMKNTAENSSDNDTTPPVPDPAEIEEFPPPPTDTEINPESDALETTTLPNDEGSQRGTNELTGELPELTSELPEPTSEQPELTGELPELTGEQPELTGELPELTNELPELKDVDEHMIGSVHDFGAAEMPMENNEEFVPASEAFNEDDEAWQIMEKMNNEENALDARESLSAFDPLTEQEVPDKVINRRGSENLLSSNSGLEDDDLILMNTPPSNKSSGTNRGGSRHPAARALQEQVEEDGGAPKEAHVVDKMLISPGKGNEIKRTSDEQEKYFDALEYPFSNGRSHQGDNEVSRMNAANKKHVDGGQDAVVQLVQGQNGRNEQVLKYSQSDWNKMKQELELEYNAKILNKEREWSKKLADRDKKISYLEDQSLLLRSANEDMKHVVAEFDKTISQLQADKEKSSSDSRNSFEDVVKERDQALEDLQSVETAFSDLHQRYERVKGVVEGLRGNEDILKKCVQDYQVKVKAAEDKAVSVRQQAEEKLDIASTEMDKLRKSTQAEVARLEAALKKADLKIQGLDRSLELKVQENEELTAICDELIAKVGGD